MACIYANDESSLSVTLQGGWVLTECFAAGENEIDRHNYSAQPRSNCKSPWIIGICIFMMEVIHNLISALKMKYKMACTLTRVCQQKKKRKKKNIYGRAVARTECSGVCYKNADFVFASIKTTVFLLQGKVILLSLRAVIIRCSSCHIVAAPPSRLYTVSTFFLSQYIVKGQIQMRESRVKFLYSLNHLGERIPWLFILNSRLLFDIAVIFSVRVLTVINLSS